MTAPDRIWTVSHAGEYGRYYPEAVEAEGEHGGSAAEYVRADIVTELVEALEAIERGQYDGLEVTHLKAKECRDIARAAIARYRGGV